MKPSDVRFVVVHCSATPPEMDIGVSVIRRWHRERGWRDVGYHFVIRRDGTVETGRSLDTPGAHAGRPINQMSLAICLAGGIDNLEDKRPEDNFTDEQRDSLFRTLKDLVERTGGQVVGHTDLPGVTKACPSFDVRAWFYRRLIEG